MENTKTEFPTIVDDAPIADCDWLPSYYNGINNNYRDESNGINSIGKIEFRAILDDNPIAERYVSPFSNLAIYDEKIAEENNKIFPYEIEDLERLYNIERFPNRIRREPRVLRKYNELANYVVVTAYLLFKEATIANKKPRLPYEAKPNPRPQLTKYAELAHEIIDAPMKSLKAKISQLDRWDYMENNPQVSFGLIKAFYDLANINPQILWNIIKNHNKLNALEEIKKLIKKDK
ncbi:hypothetical protein [Arcobacter aquimarinus]|uniref:Uncharacterized protein n=1 Tax=Arcobacter aquimarinus TaxID=1315211 RepID=A0AAE7E2G5_9BACT|nr:hypothetical protein [Arcobacter aquimarinus]QKE26606.1 hypothetical protein AAQM_1870 [Arcobacter aquimarinus]RXI36571.1 hypothetical protein CP986_01690 [Arcobacter aquimarinus]